MTYVHRNNSNVLCIMLIIARERQREKGRKRGGKKEINHIKLIRKGKNSIISFPFCLWSESLSMTHNANVALGDHWPVCDRVHMYVCMYVSE